MIAKRINKCACPRDGIGRHAWLKTTSQWGPGSSPGVGNVFQVLKSRWANLLKYAKNLIVLRDKSNSLFTPHLVIISLMVLMAFWLPSVPLLLNPVTSLPRLVVSSFHAVPEIPLISYDVFTINSSSTTSIAHAAFFYLVLAMTASLLFIWN